MPMPTFLPALIATLAATCVQIAAAETTVIYVNASAAGANDGSSWTDAFVDLQDALAAAQEGMQIWVAAGTYTAGLPDAGPVHFHLVSGVAMYGGFAGWERQVGQRDWKRNKTILSGDLDGDGETNGYQILIGTSLADDSILDGFTIQHGSIVEQMENPDGGAIRIQSSSLTIRNCTFAFNGPVNFGGAIYAADSSLLIENCDFEFNEGIWGGAVSASGSTIHLAESSFHSNNAWIEGGALDGAGSIFILTACEFHANSAADSGGAIRSFGSIISLSHCTFDSNKATFNGGALRLGEGDHYIEDSAFNNNSAIGGAAVQSGGTFHLTRCTLTNNWGEGYGAAVIAGGLIEDSTFMNNEGGLEIWSDSIISGCQFIGNSSDGGFGGVEIISAGTVEIVDSLFQWNSAYVNGGGLLINTSGSVVVSNCHFTGNVSSNNDGGGIMVKGGGQVHVTDSIIEGNFAEYGGAASVENASLIIERCTVIDNWGGLHAGFGGSLTVIDSIIADNTIEGVIVLPGVGGSAQATVVNSLIANNLGDGVHVGTGSSSLATIINSTIVNNTGTYPGTNGGMFVKAGHADVRNSIIWGNGPDGAEPMESHQIKLLDGTVDVSHSLIHMLTAGSEFDVPGANNLGDDPLFVNPSPLPGEEADFRLQAGSPAIDAGDNSFVPDPDEFPGAETDLDGNPRIIDGNGDGFAIVDLGAYEFQPSVPSIPGDLNGDGTVGAADLLILLTSWGTCASCTSCPADITSDCKVGVPDLLILLANWG